MKTHFYPVCSVTKATEGGISQKDIKQIAKRRGIECRVGPSCYVGQTAVYVRTENKRKVAAFVNEILC
jgi:hypothetical protein